MSVVVEGIETNEQLELISADGTVTEAQGYLFSRPVPAVRVRQLLNASHGRRRPDEQLLAVAIAIDRLTSPAVRGRNFPSLGIRDGSLSGRINPNARDSFA